MNVTLKRNFSWHALPLTLLDDFACRIFTENLRFFCQSLAKILSGFFDVFLEIL
jgi:hypothetical protein